MVDKTRPLKIEDTGSGGMNDFLPTEMNPSEDYVSAKGIALEESDNTRIEGNSGVMNFRDTDVPSPGVNLIDLANGGNGVSPGYSMGRSGNNGTGTWLLGPGSVPSNKSYLPVNLIDPEIVRISSGTEDLDSYTLTIYEHEGNSVNITALTTLVVSASRTGDSGNISISMTAGRQLAIQITSGSAKNITAQIVIKGTTA